MKVVSSFGIKVHIAQCSAVQTPVLQKKHLMAAQNTLKGLCTLRYNLVLNLKMFHITGSILAKARGQNVNKFYFNELGYIPGMHHRKSLLMVAYHGSSVFKHLEKASCDINYDIPAKNFYGSVAMDWEHWRPLKLISDMEENISAADVEHLARLSSEERTENKSKGFFEENKLSWLWDRSASLSFTGINKCLGNSKIFLHFSHCLGYREKPLLFLFDQDLINTIGESAALGAAGIVIWTEMNLTL
uniref:Hyaluronidase n=1 Tax=Gallus gallus TaxID=9031 RepID=A0A8V0X329_CHICK